MIRAMCFNKLAFSLKEIERICRETGGTFGGCLGEAERVNCIESFPNGDIYLTHAANHKNVVNCHNDIEKFIYVNRYGKKPGKNKK